MYIQQRPFDTAFMLLNPTYEKVGSKNIPTYPETGEKIFASLVTYGGTETIVNGVVVIISTGDVETWYRPDIKADSMLKNLENGRTYKIISDPEDINNNHLFYKFKVEYVGGVNG